MRTASRALARRIAGDIVMSDEPGAAMRKWREIFGVSRNEVARRMGVKPTVISDYERGRRVPGARFIKRFVEALIEADAERGWPVTRRLMRHLSVEERGVLALRELEEGVPFDRLLAAIDGVLLSSHTVDRIYGYTVLDSLEAIEVFDGNEFIYIMGTTSERALIFTRVSTGRSPMIAVKVAPIKPAVVVIHGTKRVDPLAIRLAEAERLPFILSTLGSVDELLRRLESLAQGQAEEGGVRYERLDAAL